MPSPARSESPMSPSPAQPTAGGIPALANFSVINYVGKIQKQSSYKTSVRSRTPYERYTSLRSAAVGLEPLVDDTTSSSSEFGCGSTVSSGSGGIPCGITSPEPSDPMDSIDTTEDGSSCTTATAAGQNRVRSRRSMSVSSSGCSSSMDDRNSDFSPLGSIVSCRCNSYSMSDFDDDGFREDSSVSTYAVFSASRSYHHPLHHHHQNVPHHPNNHKGLFDIALKTVRLIRRNQELQLRLSELQEETNAFIESVMANPENEPLRNHFYGAQNKRIPVAPPVAVQK
ncbi:uncharacterized protein LOC131210714 [Anopheles bellator]|uniref:uncharacterized protein LOC131210714 n=1 Tax=Anopheles bellator TaxID=139047 RepID=UPI00264868F2|nr:uncharacterized protein LOC131210714 [Anopheles bellator]